MSAERRSHARIAVEIPCTLSAASGECDALMRDISAVGAKLVSATRIADDYEGLELRVEPAGAHAGLLVKARVMYQRERDEGIVTGVQFLDLDADAHRALTSFLAAALGGEGGGLRKHPRVSRRIEIVCSTKKRAKAVLEDISRGGVALVLPADEAALGDPIEVSVMIGKLDRPLELRGEVVRTALDAEGNCHCGVRLHELTPGSAKLLDKLLGILVGGS